MWSGRIVYIINYFATGSGLALYNNYQSPVSGGLWALYFIYGLALIGGYVYFTVVNTRQVNARKAGNRQEDIPMNDM
jgi:hypothetical protein